MRLGEWIRILVRPLGSRKARVALATVLAAFAADWGLELSQEVVLSIVGVGVSLILGIAHEDAGRWSAGAAEDKPPASAEEPLPLRALTQGESK